eukprot:365421-Alexandrium_andersonii.AAC.1
MAERPAQPSPQELAVSGRSRKTRAPRSSCERETLATNSKRTFAFLLCHLGQVHARAVGAR